MGPPTVVIAFSRPLSSQTCTVLGLAGKPTLRISLLLGLSLGWILFHSFLSCSTPLLGKDLLQLLGTKIVPVLRKFFGTGENPVLRPPLQMLVTQTEDHLKYSHPYMGESK